jgi:hypothetical protein
LGKIHDAIVELSAMAVDAKAANEALRSLLIAVANKQYIQRLEMVIHRLCPTRTAMAAVRVYSIVLLN